MLYRHTQVGWFTIISLAVVALVMVPISVSLDFTALSVFVAVFLSVILLLFATLTIRIEADRLRFHFGIGLIRKTVKLGEVRHFAAVRNRWYWGWGIRIYPGGFLYNVSGLSAVELVLINGKRLRIGTDEPEAVCQALERVLGSPEPLGPEELLQAKRSARKLVLIFVAALVAFLGLIAGLFYLEQRSPQTTVGPQSFKVESFLYSEQFELAEITAVTLEEEPPPVQVRTNGYALGGTLRGHFRVNELGDGQLFIEYFNPPYVLVKRGSDYVAVNFEQADETRALFVRLERAWKEARGGS